MEAVYRRHRGKTNLFITSYIFRRSLIIDSLYSEEIATPCHFCRFDRLPSTNRDPRAPSQDGWLSFAETLQRSFPDFPFSLPISAIERGFVTYLLCKRAESLVGTTQSPLSHDQISETLSVDLETSSITSEYVLHFPYCECLIS
jgi:McbB family protein